MNENSPDIRRLNDAIESLNGDAEGMHALVTRSTEELERATAEGKRAADLAEEALKALAPIAEELKSATADAKGLLAGTGETVDRLGEGLAWAQKEGKEAFDSFAAASLDASKSLVAETDKAVLRLSDGITQARESGREAFDAFRAESLEGAERTREELLTSITQAQESGRKAFDTFKSESLDESRKTKEELLASVRQSQEAGQEAFDEFASASLKAAEKTRDDLQTDLLSHKTAMAARMDSLEAATTKRLGDLEGAVARLEEETKRAGDSIGERVDLLQKKVSLPLYGVIAVAALQLVTLAMLLLR